MYTVVPHQVVRLKNVQPCPLQDSELFELWYIDFRGEQYYIENDNSTPVGIAVKFDLMIIDEYNDSENNIAVIRCVK